MSVKVTPPVLTSDTVLFQNKAAAQSFFNGIEVPSAGINSEGVVKQATTLGYAAPANLNIGYVQFNIEGDLVLIVNKADIDTLLQKFNELASSYASLVTKLKAAGILQS